MTDTIRRFECPECGRKTANEHWVRGGSHAKCPGTPVERVYVPREAVMPLWEGYADHWGDPSEMFDSSLALPCLPIKGKTLYSIALDLGLKPGEDDDLAV